MAVVIELRRSQWAIFYGDPRDEAGYAELLSIASTLERDGDETVLLRYHAFLCDRRAKYVTKQGLASR